MFLRMLLRGEIGARRVVRGRRVVGRRPRRGAARVPDRHRRARLRIAADAPRAAAGARCAIAAREHAHRQRAQHPRALRSRQRVLSAVPRSRNAVVLVRHLDRRAAAGSQHAKHERLCELLELSPRDHLLEIGCGWGGMAIHAAKTRGCRVTAITISREQQALAARARRRRPGSPIASRSSCATTAISAARSTRSSRSRCSRLSATSTCPATSRRAIACSRPAAASRSRRSRCPTIATRRIEPRRLDADVHLPRLVHPVARRDPRRARRHDRFGSCAPTTSAPTTRRRFAPGAIGSSPHACRAAARVRRAVRTNVVALSGVQRGRVRRAHARRPPARVRALTAAECSTVTVVVIPPRTQNLPVTVIDRGAIARHDVVADPVRHRFVERALIAIAPQVELQALELDAQRVRNVIDEDRGEIGLAGDRAQDT